MRRLTLTTLALAALTAGATAHAQEPPLSAKATVCHRGPEPADRFAEFTASMPREDAAIMGMRFVLYEKQPGGKFQRVKLPNWEEWERTGKAGVPGFVFTKRVEQLAAPAVFKAIVTFRWYDDEGDVLRTTKRISNVCRQPDWRANLVIEKVVFGTDGRARATIANRGRTATGDFGLAMGVADHVGIQKLTGLAPGERSIVPLSRCRAPEQATVTIDHGDAVDEADEGDNVVTLPCPADRQ